MTSDTRTLTPELLRRIEAYCRAANYLSVGEIYLYDNPLIKRTLTLADVKRMLQERRGHAGSPELEMVPGLRAEDWGHTQRERGAE